MTNTTNARRSYFYVSPRGFSNEITVYATRNPKAMATVLDMLYGADVNAQYGPWTRRQAIAENAWAASDPWDSASKTLEGRIADAERAGNELIAAHVDPHADDLEVIVAELEQIELEQADLIARRDDAIRAAYKRQTLAEIAETTGLSVQRVSQIIAAG